MLDAVRLLYGALKVFDQSTIFLAASVRLCNSSTVHKSSSNMVVSYGQSNPLVPLSYRTNQLH